MSNLSAIGFGGSTVEDFQRTVEAAIERAGAPPELGAFGARYLWFRDPSGAAIAVRLDRRNRIECMTPFFAASDGGTRWQVRTQTPHLDRKCIHCSGADCDVLERASGGLCTRTTLQFLYFEPYRAWLQQERTFDATVVGFASALALCASREEFEAAHVSFGFTGPLGMRDDPAKPLRLADRAFLSVGMFGGEGHLGTRARAVLSGDVESVAVERNTVSGLGFVHARVRTIAGPIDLVAPADAVKIPVHATLALAECWLVARPVDPPPPEAGFLRRLLRRNP